MADLSKQQVQAQSQQFVTSLGRPAFVLIGWQKEDGTVAVVQTLEQMNPIAYVKAMTWALNEVTGKM